MEIIMKVYVVTETSYDGYEDGHTTVDRVFSSEEKAKAYLEAMGSNRWSDYDYEVFEVQ
jgi:hypothetical protein